MINSSCIESIKVGFIIGKGKRKREVFTSDTALYKMEAIARKNGNQRESNPPSTKSDHSTINPGRREIREGGA